VNIFILTDGAVSNPDSVVELVKKYTKADFRFYTLGLGSGVSRYLIEMVGKYGGGM